MWLPVEPLEDWLCEVVREVILAGFQVTSSLPCGGHWCFACSLKWVLKMEWGWEVLLMVWEVVLLFWQDPRWGGGSLFAVVMAVPFLILTQQPPPG